MSSKSNDTTDITIKTNGVAHNGWADDADSKLNLGRAIAHTTLRFPAKERLGLKIKAAQRGITMEQAILEAYYEWIEERPHKRRHSPVLTRQDHMNNLIPLLAAVVAKADERRLAAITVMLEVLGRE